MFLTNALKNPNIIGIDSNKESTARQDQSNQISLSISVNKIGADFVSAPENRAAVRPQVPLSHMENTASDTGGELGVTQSSTRVSSLKCDNQLISGNDMHALFRDTSELSELKKTPQGHQHRLDGAVAGSAQDRLDKNNRHLTQAIKQHGPQKRFEEAAMSLIPDREAAKATKYAQANGFDMATTQQFVATQQLFSVEKSKNTPEVANQLKEKLTGAVSAKYGLDPQSSAAFKNSVFVVSTVTNLEEYLLLDPAAPKELEEGKPLPRTKHSGICFGRSCQFISRVAEETEKGTPFLEAVQVSSIDSGNLFPSALKQKIAMNTASSNMGPEQFHAKMQHYSGLMNSGQMSLPGAVENINKAATEHLASGKEKLAISAGLDREVTSSRGSLFMGDVIQGAINLEGMSLLTGNNHAISVMKKDDIIVVFNPDGAAVATASGDSAEKLISASFGFPETPDRYTVNTFGAVPNPTLNP